MHKFSGRIVVLAVSISFMCAGAMAKPSKQYPKKLFSLSAMHFNAERQPHGPEWYLGSDEGKAALGYLASALGVAPAYVAMAKAAIPPPKMEGAQTDYRVPLAKGYVPCAAMITVQTIIPASGSPFSTINAAINPDEIQLSTVTPVLGGIDGRSMAIGDVAYYGIQAKYRDEFVKKGVCRPVAKQEFLYSCTSKAACNTPGTWGDPSAAARLAAALAKR